LDSKKYAEALKQNNQRKQDNTEIIDENQKVVYVHPEDINANLPTQALLYKDGNSATVIVFSEPIVVKSIGNLNFTTASNAIKSGGYFFRDTEVNPSFVQIKNLSLTGTKCSPKYNKSVKNEGFVSVKEGLLTQAQLDANVTGKDLQNAGMICVPSTDTDQTDLTTMLQTDSNAPLAKDITNAGNWHTVLSWITPVVIFGFALILLPFLYFQSFIPYVKEKSSDPGERYNKVVIYHFAILIPIIILSILFIGIGSVEDMNLMTNGIALIVISFIIGFVLFTLLPLYDKFKKELEIEPDTVLKINIKDAFVGGILKINKLFWPIIWFFSENKVFGWTDLHKTIKRSIFYRSIWTWFILYSVLFTAIFIPVYQVFFSDKSPSQNMVRLLGYLFYLIFLAFISSILWILNIKFNNETFDTMYEK